MLPPPGTGLTPPPPEGSQLIEVTQTLLDNTGAQETETTIADQRARILNNAGELIDRDGDRVVIDAGTLDNPIPGGVIAGNVVIRNAEGEEETLTPSCAGSAGGLARGNIACTATTADRQEIV